MPAVPRSHVTSQISKLEALCLIYIPAKFQKLIPNEQLVEKERCQGQCDLSLLTWALMGVPSTRVSLQKCMLWGLVSIQVLHLQALPHMGWASVQPFCSDCCSLWRIKLSRQSLLGAPSLSRCQPQVSSVQLHTDVTINFFLKCAVISELFEKESRFMELALLRRNKHGMAAINGWIQSCHRSKGLRVYIALQCRRMTKEGV